VQQLLLVMPGVYTIAAYIRLLCMHVRNTGALDRSTISGTRSSTLFAYALTSAEHYTYLGDCMLPLSELYGACSCLAHPVTITHTVDTHALSYNRPPPSAEVLARIEANRQAALQRLREVAAARPKPASPTTDTTTDTSDTTAASASTTATSAAAAADDDFENDYEELMRGANNANNSSGISDPMQEELEAAMEMDFDFDNDNDNDNDYNSSTANVTSAKSAATAKAAAASADSINATSSGAATDGATDMETDAVSRYV
jgi:hypothetical protein